MKNKRIIKEIILFILIAMFFASNIIIREVSNLDELWNYNFANNIANGLVPYKDFNMVVTPLLSIIGGMFLTIFGKELLIFRILNIVLNTSIIFLMYKIMDKLKIKKYITLILLFLLTYVYKKYAMFDYNFAVSFVSLIIVNLEIKNYESKRKSYQILIGVLAGICITLKQTTGIIIAIALLGYKILDIRNKKELKKYLRQLTYRIIGLAIPVLIMILYLLVNNALFDFMDYCILGVSTFSNKISYHSRLIKNQNLIIKILGIMPISLFILLIRYIRKRDKNALILFTFGLSTLSVVYPISDESHLIPGVLITTIGAGYILNNLINKQCKIFEIFCSTFIVLFVIYQFINGMYIYAKSTKNTELAHYKGIRMTESQQEANSIISEYIKNSDKKVYILDATAAYYMIPLDRYNKNYDMFCLGNFGSKGEQGQIENLQKEKESIKLLIKKEKYKRNWQNPEKVRRWVIDNFNKVGQIGGFDIYE